MERHRTRYTSKRALDFQRAIKNELTCFQSSIYFLIILDDEGHDEEYVQRRLNHLFMKQTNLIKNNRSEKQQAWNISVKQCALSERAYLNQKNFQIFFHHASQYRLVRNAYYALLNDFREVRIYDLMSLMVCITNFSFEFVNI